MYAWGNDWAVVSPIATDPSDNERWINRKRSTTEQKGTAVEQRKKEDGTRNDQVRLNEALSEMEDNESRSVHEI